MARPAKASTPPLYPKTGETALDRAHAAHQAAIDNRKVIQNKLSQLIERRDALSSNISRQRGVLMGAGDRMATDPTPETKDAFAVATAQSSSLSAQAEAIEDRLLPSAKNALGAAEAELDAAEARLSRIIFQQAIRDRLLPADRRFLEAMVTANEALEACQAARRELMAEYGYSPWGRADAFSSKPLWSAIPFEFVRFMHGFPRISPVNPLPDLMQYHARTFGLDQDEVES